MDELTYKDSGKKVGQYMDIYVYLDGVRIGSILEDEASYYYRTKSGREGERFNSVDEVKRSLETDQ